MTGFVFLTGFVLVTTDTDVCNTNVMPLSKHRILLETITLISLFKVRIWNMKDVTVRSRENIPQPVKLRCDKLLSVRPKKPTLYFLLQYVCYRVAAFI